MGFLKRMILNLKLKRFNPEARYQQFLRRDQDPFNRERAAFRTAVAFSDWVELDGEEFFVMQEELKERLLG